MTKANSNLHKAKKVKNDEFYEIKDEPNYLISKEGKVFSLTSNKILKNIKLKTGYLKVALSNRKQKYLHRLVAETFIPNPLNLPFVNHVDENPENNSIDNLEWVTHKENIRHSCKSTKSYLFKEPSYYSTNPCTRSDFKRICNRHSWDINNFIEKDSGLKRYSNKKYFYFIKD